MSRTAILAMTGMVATAGYEPRFLTEDGAPRAFVVLSSARSGSNLLVSYLRQVRRAACFGEILRDGFPDSPGWAKLLTRLDMPAESERLYREDLTDFWDVFLAQGLSHRQWFGAKIFYYHRAEDPVWERFGARDHRIFHLWRDATFDQYVSRSLAVTSGEWKSTGESEADLKVRFDRDDYLVYRQSLRTQIDTARTRFGDTGRFEDIEYRQLSDHAFVADLLGRLFGERPELVERRVRQRSRPKIEYLSNPEDARPFIDDSISGGFAAG